METTDKQLKALEAAVTNAATDEERVEALNALAVEQWAQGLTISLATAERAHQLASDIGSVPGLIRSLCNEGHLCYRQSKNAVALARLNEALKRIQADADPSLTSLEAECRHYLGLVHYGGSALEAAMDQFLMAQTLYEQANDRTGLAQVLNDIGNLYSRMNDSAHALSSYLNSLARREANGDRRGVACSLNNIGNIYAEMLDLAQAVRTYEQCLAIARETGYVRLEMRCLSSLSPIYAKLDRWEEAFEASRTALSLARSGGHRDNESLALMSLAGTHKMAGQFICAVPLYLEALAIAWATEERRDECEIQVAIGECFLALEQLAEARTALTDAASNAAALEMKPILFRAFLGLSEVCQQEGKFALALDFYQKFHTVQQEVLSTDTENRTKALLIQMQVEQVRKDAEIQRLRNVELAQANAALEDANRTLQTQAELLEAQAEELQAQAGELARQAAEDGLTGLANRRHLEGWLARQFYQARQENSPLTVALADVDHFKQVNDRFGHQIGDEVLMTVAQLFRQNCRAADLAARYGGEEFVLALPDTDACQAFVLCERLRTAIESHDWSAIHPDLAVTLSMGLSDDLSGGSHERLLGLADAQLYAAKQSGRNRVFPPACSSLSIISP